MPTKPPMLHPRPRKPWQRFDEPKRLRGRAGVAARLRVLDEEPLCRVCTAAGRVSASVEVDHIVPLFEGGSDDRGNKQGLCTACHKAKTAAESMRGRETRR